MHYLPNCITGIACDVKCGWIQCITSVFQEKNVRSAVDEVEMCRSKEGSCSEIREERLELRSGSAADVEMEQSDLSARHVPA